MRLLVCGGRDFFAADFIDDTLTWFCLHVAEIKLLIHGDAPGADTICRQWAEKYEIPVKTCPANWKKYGPAAGPIRNGEMLKLRPDEVLAFPGGRGTANMVAQAKAAGVKVRRVKPRKGYHQTSHEKLR